MDLPEIMNRRFESTPKPSLTGDAGKDVESIIQWLLVFSLFKDFVYRDCKGGQVLKYNKRYVILAT